MCRECLAQLVRNKAECPLCKVPARRRDIRGDACIDRIAQLVAQLQALGAGCFGSRFYDS